MFYRSRKFNQLEKTDKLEKPGVTINLFGL